MGMEIEVTTEAAQVEETLVSDKENKSTPPTKDNSDPVVPVAELATETKKEGGIIEATTQSSSILPPKDATDVWDTPKQTHTFYFAKIRMIEDPKVKTKLDQLHKTLNNNKAQKGNVLSQLADKRKERNEIIKQLKPLTDKAREYSRMMNEKMMAMAPLRDELGKIRFENNAIKEKGVGLCSSVKELDDRLKSLEYRMSHESMPLDEEKRLMKEIKQLEGTRAKVTAHAATRAKLDHENEKIDIQDKVKLIGADMDEVRREREVIRAQIKPLEDLKTPIEASIKILEDQLNEINEKNKKAYDSIVELNSGKESLNVVFTENRKILTQAKVIASKKDVAALEALANSEMEKFMAQWGKKPFRDDYEKRILSSLDQRFLSRDGRIRNPDEKPIIAPEPVKASSEPGPTTPASLPKPAPIRHSNNKEEEAAAEEVKVATNLEAEGAKKKEKEKKEKEKVDMEKLKELKREEEIAKNKMALERKKKLAEKKLAKAEAKALKEAEEKLKKKEKKAKKKGGASSAPEGSDEAATETDPNPEESVEPEDETKDETDPALTKSKPQKESVRQRGGGGGKNKGQSQLPRAILKRKKSSHSYWSSSWGPLSVVAVTAVALAVILLGGFAYWYKYYYLLSGEKIQA